jgi:hypothetical protein
MIKLLQTFSHDPDFRRGFRRGVGLILASFVILQCLICTFWPLVVR